MELTQTQYDQISDCFPKHRGSLTYSNLHAINAFLYIVKNGCKWRALPERFGNWHTIYYSIRVFMPGMLCKVLSIEIASWNTALNQSVPLVFLRKNNLFLNTLVLLEQDSPDIVAIKE
ncbi:MAG: transposase [Cytophagaceae bacterium]|nr:transposase [Cytophagaceae bacterium]